jgi:hypothetical protein
VQVHTQERRRALCDSPSFSANSMACTATVIAVQIQRRTRATAARVWVVLVEREVDAAAGDDPALGSTVLLPGTELPHAALTDFTTPL